jgi:hypothetical protein
MSNKIAFLLGVVFVAIVVGGGIEYHEGSWDVSLLPQEAAAYLPCTVDCVEGSQCHPYYWTCIGATGCLHCHRGFNSYGEAICVTGVGACDWFPPPCS